MQIFRNRWFIVAVLMLSAVSGHSRQVECFVAGTQILMADGSSKNIEDIQPGDLVRSYHTDTRRFENRAVTTVMTELHSGTGDDLTVQIVFSDGTMNHNTITESYWVEGKGWASVRPDLTYEFNGLRVQTLQEGDTVYRTPDGHSLSPLKITTIRVSSEAVRTYNLYEVVPAAQLALVIPGVPAVLGDQVVQEVQVIPGVPVVPTAEPQLRRHRRRTPTSRGRIAACVTSIPRCRTRPVRSAPPVGKAVGRWAEPVVPQVWSVTANGGRRAIEPGGRNGGRHAATREPLRKHARATPRTRTAWVIRYSSVAACSLHR